MFNYNDSPYPPFSYFLDGLIESITNGNTSGLTNNYLKIEDIKEVLKLEVLTEYLSSLQESILNKNKISDLLTKANKVIDLINKDYNKFKITFSDFSVTTIEMVISIINILDKYINSDKYKKPSFSFSSDKFINIKNLSISDISNFPNNFFHFDRIILSVEYFVELINILLSIEDDDIIIDKTVQVYFNTRSIPYDIGMYSLGYYSFELCKAVAIAIKDLSSSHLYKNLTSVFYQFIDYNSESYIFFHKDNPLIRFTFPANFLQVLLKDFRTQEFVYVHYVDIKTFQFKNLYNDLFIKSSDKVAFLKRNIEKIEKIYSFNDFCYSEETFFAGSLGIPFPDVSDNEYFSPFIKSHYFFPYKFSETKKIFDFYETSLINSYKYYYKIALYTPYLNIVSEIKHSIEAEALYNTYFFLKEKYKNQKNTYKELDAYSKPIPNNVFSYSSFFSFNPTSNSTTISKSKSFNGVINNEIVNLDVFLNSFFENDIFNFTFESFMLNFKKNDTAYLKIVLINFKNQLNNKEQGHYMDIGMKCNKLSETDIAQINSVYNSNFLSSPFPPKFDFSLSEKIDLIKKYRSFCPELNDSPESKLYQIEMFSDSYLLCYRFIDDLSKHVNCIDTSTIDDCAVVVKTETSFEKSHSSDNDVSNNITEDPATPVNKNFYSPVVNKDKTILEQIIYSGNISKFHKLESHLKSIFFIDENHKWLKSKVLLCNFLSYLIKEKYFKQQQKYKLKKAFHYVQFLSQRYGLGKTGLSESWKKFNKDIDIELLKKNLFITNDIFNS